MVNEKLPRYVRRGRSVGSGYAPAVVALGIVIALVSYAVWWFSR